MTRRLRLRPLLEVLEDRFVPATIRLMNGSLFISNPTIQANGKASLTVTQQATANTFQVKDGTAVLGTYSASRLVSIQGRSGADSITFATGTATYSGSLFINSSNGTDTIAVTGAGGTIAGDVNVFQGHGNSTVGLNSSATGALTIRGNTSVINQTGNDSVSLGDVVLTGNVPTGGAGATNFRGNVNITGVSTVVMGSGDQADSYGGDVNVSDVNSNTPLFFVQGQHLSQLGSAGIQVQIAGSLRVSAGTGSTTVGAIAGNQIFTGDLVVGKDLVINAGHATAANAGTGIGNGVGLGQSAVGFTTVNGNLHITNGSGTILVDLGGDTFNGNAFLNLGNGSSSVALDRGFTGTTPIVFNGDLVINASTGDLNLNPFGSRIQGPIGGNFQVNAGNGTLTMPFDTTFANVGGKVIVRTGNGNNTVSFANSGVSAAPVFALDILFGNGNDTLTLNDALAGVTGRVNGGNGTNTFNHIAGNIIPPWQLVNF